MGYVPLPPPPDIFEGVDMLPGKPNIPRPIPPSDGPGWTEVGGVPDKKPAPIRAEQLYYDQPTIWQWMMFGEIFTVIAFMIYAVAVIIEILIRAR